MCIYFKRIVGIGSGNYIYFWKSKGLPEEKINSIVAFNYSITPELTYHGSKIRIKFNRRCLKQDKPTYIHGKTVNIYIVYEIRKNLSSYLTLKICLFVAVPLTDQYKYSGYGTGFDKNRNDLLKIVQCLQ